MRFYIKRILQFMQRRLLGPVEFKTSTPDGPFKVGLKVDFITADGRQMRVLTWYPATPAGGAAPHKSENGLIGTAVLDARPDDSGAPYPAVKA